MKPRLLDLFCGAMTDRELDRDALKAASISPAERKAIRDYFDAGGEAAIRASERARLKEKLGSEDAAATMRQAVPMAWPDARRAMAAVVRLLEDEDG